MKYQVKPAQRRNWIFNPIILKNGTIGSKIKHLLNC